MDLTLTSAEKDVLVRAAKAWLREIERRDSASDTEIVLLLASAVAKLRSSEEIARATADARKTLRGWV